MTRPNMVSKDLLFKNAAFPQRLDGRWYDVKDHLVLLLSFSYTFCVIW